MGKKEKPASKKANAAAKKGEKAPSDSGKGKKGGKERFKGKGKWAGNSGDDDLGTELAALGLRIKDITGDGNCFFRALGDQLQGDERQHVQLRQRVVSYILDNRDDFAPFVEDDENFDSYTARMKKDGVWAGYMEVVAASRCLGANLTIYQAGQPRWRVIHHPEHSAPMLHLSYHDGQHYNSVRCANDFGTGPPAPVVIRGDGTMPAKPPRPPSDDGWGSQDEQGTSAEDAAGADAGAAATWEQLPKAAGGDREMALAGCVPAMECAGLGEAACEALRSAGEIAASAAAAAAEAPRSAEGAGMAEPGPTRQCVTATAGEAASEHGAAAAGDCGATAESRSMKSPQEPAGAAPNGAPGADAAATSSAADTAVSSAPTQAAAAKPIRVGGTRVAAGKAVVAAAARRTAAGSGKEAAPSKNKRCPCGSNKKYKACCGAAAAAAERRRAAAGGGAEDTGKAAAGSDKGAQSGTPTVLVAQVAALVI